MKKRLSDVGLVVLAMAIVAIASLFNIGGQEAEAQYSVPCYREIGGAKWVAESGCEYEFQSGSTLDIQDGTTLSISDITATDDMTVTGDLYVGGTSDLRGNISDGGGIFTIADNVLVDGQADAIQMRVQGYTTQTNSILVLEQSDGTDVATVSNAGNVDVAGTINFGSDNNYALGFATANQEMVCGEQTITGTAAIAVSGLTTVTKAIATLATDPGAGAGDPFLVTIDDPTTSTVTINVWQDDATAGTSGALVHYCAVGDQ